MVDGFVIAGSLRVAFCCKSLAFEYESFATGLGAVEVVESFLVEGLVDGLDTVSVIVGELGVVRFLNQEVDAAVDDTESIEVDDVLFSFFVDCFIGDALILLFKVCGEGRPVTSAILAALSLSIHTTLGAMSLTDSVKIDIASLLGLYAGNFHKHSASVCAYRYRDPYLLKPCLSEMP